MPESIFNTTKKYVSLSKLETFLTKLKNTFASISHNHTISDITDYNVDNTLSSTSTNPVQNKIINAEFDEIATAMNALDTSIDIGLNAKMDKSNPTGTGSLSINRKSDTTIGTNSVALGSNATASAEASFGFGYEVIASGDGSYAEGAYTTATSDAAHAEGWGSKATGTTSHAEGEYTIANGKYQHTQGKYNIADTTSAHIVGNGTKDTARSNAHTLDFNGNAWFAGDVYVGSTSGTNKDGGSVKLVNTTEMDEAVSTKTQVQFITLESGD